MASKGQYISTQNSMFQITTGRSRNVSPSFPASASFELDLTSRRYDIVLS